MITSSAQNDTLKVTSKYDVPSKKRKQAYVRYYEMLLYRHRRCNESVESSGQDNNSQVAEVLFNRTTICMYCDQSDPTRSHEKDHCRYHRTGLPPVWVARVHCRSTGYCGDVVLP